MVVKPLAQACCLPQSTHLIKSTPFSPFFSFQFPFNSMKNKYAEDHSGETTEALALLMEDLSGEGVGRLCMWNKMSGR